MEWTFKNKNEKIMFILMNIFGSPLAFIVSAVFLSWQGIVGCLVLFLITYKLWKKFGGHKDARLKFSPKIRL